MLVMKFMNLFRYSAFSTVPWGGNPAGVWIGDELPDVNEMQQIAADVDYPETAFIAPQTGTDRTIRYFSPKIEVPFCGHATIATGVVLGRTCGQGMYRLSASVGMIPVEVTCGATGDWEAKLTSVEPEHGVASVDQVEEALAFLHWNERDLDLTIPPAFAFAGSWHLVIAVSSRERLSELSYDFDALAKYMRDEGIVTLQLVFQERDDLFHARNPFPIGGIVEDPATGAAAAALGGYLRSLGRVSLPSQITIRQGEDMGRLSLIRVGIPISGGITVSGNAVEIEN